MAKKNKVTEVLILECFVAGLIHHEFTVGRSKLTIGQKLRLVAEPDNPHDADAIAIYAGEVKLGYIPGAATGQIHDRDGDPVRCVVKQFAPTNPTHRMVLVHVYAKEEVNKVTRHELASY